MKRSLFVFLVAVLTIVSLAAVGCTSTPAAPDEGTAAPDEGDEVSTPAAPEGKTYNWTFLHEHPSGTPHFNYCVEVAKALEEATDGQMTMKVSAGGEIVPSYDIVEALKDGVAETGWGNGTSQVKLIGPAGYLLTPTGLPGGPNPIELLAWYYIGGGEELANNIWGDWAVSVGCIPGEAELFCHSNVKLESMADFKGVKFRTMGFWAEVLENNGASVVTLSGSELYESAQRGVIDAFEYCPPAQNWPMGFHEITKYVGVPGIHSPSWSTYVLVNHAAWDDLPADLQREVVDQWKVGVIDHFLADWYHDGEVMNMYEDYGTEIVTVSDEAQVDIAKAGLAICEKYAAEDATFATVWEHQKAFFKTMRIATQDIAPQISLFDYVD
ncbi:MAG: hypothetical protein JW846_05695 [Dehalococcoidia bacterium]|nr:hypothetical protein [Dehalococcoidia bacterium]